VAAAAELALRVLQELQPLVVMVAMDLPLQ
jgi:hypothetical protein